MDVIKLDLTKQGAIDINEFQNQLKADDNCLSTKEPNDNSLFIKESLEKIPRSKRREFVKVILPKLLAIRARYEGKGSVHN